MHPFLQRQQLEYTIFLVEQMYDDAFNKGILMNAAFQQIFEQKIANSYDCLFFHDIDLLPIGST